MRITTAHNFSSQGFELKFSSLLKLFLQILLKELGEFSFKTLFIIMNRNNQTQNKGTPFIYIVNIRVCQPSVCVCATRETFLATTSFNPQ
jgi:hypothetical protein